ncbi:SRPBCC family protein [Flexivirga sp. ID2601S]|uniref:SRPBCC family protein n=1 Tax=Flexivirga aerilata TaxID=1656889 RepID=A0A849ASF9_9MICO|nr:SRPBCC family protein [Flexivirga aerilata]NNG41210.1 SRPBCC family protein [Flexivirga aerilata]
MNSPLDVSASVLVPADPERAFRDVLVAPLPQLFAKRHLALPPIKEVRGQQGVWGTVGQTRTIVLADGGTMREELVSVESPTAFSYHIGDITGALRPLAGGVDGRWSFTPRGAETQVTWAWRVYPRMALSSIALPVFGRMWQGYADKALAQVRALF